MYNKIFVILTDVSMVVVWGDTLDSVSDTLVLTEI